jgi:ribosomal protein S18 acetylase RimI-like enzyme
VQPGRPERLILPVGEADLRGLALLLVDAVESGAAVSFLAPLTLERAEEWWRQVLSASHARSIFLVVREPGSAHGGGDDGDDDGVGDGRIAGTVQLQPAWAPNQPHRAEITKLLVHRRCRRQGLGLQLMQAIEEEARRSGFALLTLDARRGEAAEQLYRKTGWVAVGTIPAYALDPDGATSHDAVLFYKTLDHADDRHRV